MTYGLMCEREVKCVRCKTKFITLMTDNEDCKPICSYNNSCFRDYKKRVENEEKLRTRKEAEKYEE